MAPTHRAAPLVRGLGARRLYVWRCDGVVCAWLLRRGAVTRGMLEQLRHFVEPHVRFVVPQLAEQHANALASLPASALAGADGAAHKFVYHNASNLALKTSLVRGRARLLPPPPLRAVVVARAAFAAHRSATLQLKLADDTWLVACKASEREFECLFDSTKLNLIEVHTETQRLVAIFFGPLFVND